MVVVEVEKEQVDHFFTGKLEELGKPIKRVVCSRRATPGAIDRLSTVSALQITASERERRTAKWTRKFLPYWIDDPRNDD